VKTTTRALSLRAHRVRPLVYSLPLDAAGEREVWHGPGEGRGDTLRLCPDVEPLPPVRRRDEYIARVGRYIHLNPAETEAMKRKSLPRRKAHLNGFRCGRDLAEAGGQRADGKDSEHRTEAGKAAEATAPKG